MPNYYYERADVILLDIEGTTTPIDYVFLVLFPFAKEQVESFLQIHHQESGVQADLMRLRQEYEADVERGLAVPAWVDKSAIAAVPYIHYLIATDRKSTGLKSLQGKIWEQGYRDGTLRSQLFPMLNLHLNVGLVRASDYLSFRREAFRRNNSYFGILKKVI